MADNLIILPDDSANTGKQLDTSSLTVAAQTVHRERMNIADPTTDVGLAKVVNSAPTTEYGLVTRAAGVTKVSQTDGTNTETSLFDLDTGAGSQYAQGVSLRKAASGGSVEYGTTSDPLHVADAGGSLTVDNAGLTELAAAINASSQMDVNLAASNATVTVSATNLDIRDLTSTDVVTANLSATDNAVLDNIDADTSAIQTAVELIDDTVATLGTTTYAEATTKGLTIGAVRRDADTTLVNTTNEIGPLQMDANGRLKVEIFDGGDSHTVDGTVTANLAAGTNNIGDVDVLSIAAGDNNIGNVDIASIAAGTNYVGKVRLTDGTTDTDIRDLTNSNALNVAIVDGSGDQITSFGGGTQYTEDAAAAANPVGNALIMVRDDALSGQTTADGDNVAARGTDKGELYVKHADTIAVTQSGTWDEVGINDSGNSITVDNGGTFVVQENGAALTSLQLIDDAVYVDDADWTDNTSKHLLVGGLYQATPQTVTDGDVAPFLISANGKLQVEGSFTAGVIQVDASGGADTNVGYDTGNLNVPVQCVEGQVDDAAFTPATSNVMMMGAEFDDNTPDSVDEGDGGAVRMSANRNMYVRIRDNAGNERGLNVDANGAIAVTQSGTWDEVGINDSGNSITVDNAALSVVGGGVEASALRVTIASDSTGVLSVDDNGGALTVDNAGTFAVQATVAAAATNIAKAEDVASAGADVGVPAMAVQKATPANTAGTDGDYEFLQMSAGRLWASATIDAALPAGTNAIGKLAANSGVDIGDVDVTSVTPGSAASNLGKAEDAAHSSGDVGVMALGVRDTAPATISSADGDYEPVHISDEGGVWVSPTPSINGGASTINSSSSDGGTALTNSAQQIKDTAGVLLGYYIYNPNSSAQFVQFYNTVDTSVTVGTTSPLFMLTIPATSAANLAFTFPITFGTAMSWSATSTAGGNGAPTTALDAVCWYK